MGSLESEVLQTLWDAGEALTPGEVRTRLGDDLAYTTVMTILGRMWKKGVVERSQAGRAYAYRAASNEADYVAERMRVELDKTTHRDAVLSRFVERLDPADTEALTALLRRLDHPS